jgi:hypothetical protein
MRQHVNQWTKGWKSVARLKGYISDIEMEWQKGALTDWIAKPMRTWLATAREMRRQLGLLLEKNDSNSAWLEGERDLVRSNTLSATETS